MRTTSGMYKIGGGLIGVFGSVAYVLEQLNQIPEPYQTLGRGIAAVLFVLGLYSAGDGVKDLEMEKRLDEITEYLKRKENKIETQ